jgi:hypothetical protein
MEQPVKVAMPPTAFSGFAEVQVRAPPPGFEPVPGVIARVTADVSPVTVLPKESSTETTGWVPKAVPPVAVLLGGVVKASWWAAPALMVNVLLAAEISVPSVAVRV